MPDPDAHRRRAHELFDRLELSGWRTVNQSLKAGGQAGVLVVRNSVGDRGVFRCLAQTNKVAVDRFYRELAILTDQQFQHPNIVELLDWTKDRDHPWYISRLGRPLNDWWPAFRKKRRSRPDLLVSNAVGIVSQLADGLTPLHEAGVVHRDIKPANIVVDDSGDPIRPALIDFGLAYTVAGERLTADDATVANKRFSPDVMMNRMDRVPPWLDVFQLAQVLIWMIAEPTAVPHWDRPLDWRFVNYDDRLPDDVVLALRAITALCSEERISPPDGRALVSLLKERFPMGGTTGGEVPKVDVSKIRQGIARGKSAQDIELAGDAHLIKASAAAVALVYQELRAGLEALTGSMGTAVPVHKSADASLQSFGSTLTTRAGGSNEATLYQLDLGDPAGQRFHFRVQCVAFIPSLRQHMSGALPPESSNLFCLYLQRYANLSRLPFPHETRVLTVENDGGLTLRTERMAAIERTSLPGLLAMVRQWLEDPAPWERIQKDR